jgi:hypothetical protein
MKRANQIIPLAVELTRGENTPVQGVFLQTLRTLIHPSPVSGVRVRQKMVLPIEEINSVGT